MAVVAAVGLLAPAFTIRSDGQGSPAIDVLVVALLGAALVLAYAFYIGSTPARIERLDRSLLGLGLLTLVGYSLVQLHVMGNYATDEAALIQGAALALVHGHDPYGANLAGSLSAYGVLAPTYLVGGGVVTTLGYPALPVLASAPAVAISPSLGAVSAVDDAALVLATVLMWMALPRAVRALAVIVCVDIATLPTFANAGVSTVMMLPALTFVASRWADVGSDGRLGWGGRGRAAALGLAAASNQLAWFVAPFLLAGMWLSRRADAGRAPATRIVAGYAAIAIAAFAIVDAPFVIWNAGAWATGVLAPLRQHAAPYGQGLIGLTLFGRLGGGALSAYSGASICLYGALLVLYVIRWSSLHRACFALPLLVQYASERSLSGHWLVLIGVLVVSVADQRERPRLAPAVGARRTRVGALRVGTVALFAPATVFLAVALLTPAPLSIRILAAGTREANGHVVEVDVAVQNRSHEPLRPRFAIDAAHGSGAYWLERMGPATLAPGGSADYVLRAPNAVSSPAVGASFIVHAITASPLTISSSGAMFAAGGQS